MAKFGLDYIGADPRIRLRVTTRHIDDNVLGASDRIWPAIKWSVGEKHGLRVSKDKVMWGKNYAR